jgi:hypothetical protein
MALVNDEVCITLGEPSKRGDVVCQSFEVSCIGNDQWLVFYDILKQNATRGSSVESNMGLCVDVDEPFCFKLTNVSAYASQAVHEEPAVFVLDNMMASLGFSLRRSKKPKPSSQVEGSGLASHLGLEEAAPCPVTLQFERSGVVLAPPAKKRKTLASTQQEPSRYVSGTILDQPHKSYIKVVETEGNVTLISRDKIESIVGHKECLVDFYMTSGRVIQVQTRMPGESAVCQIHSLSQLNDCVKVSVQDDVLVYSEPHHPLYVSKQ